MKKRIAIILLAIAACIPVLVNAATMSIVVASGQGNPTVNQPFEISVSLDTKGDTMNAVQGTVTFPANQMMFDGITDDDSPISFWIEQPEETASGVIEFSGIIPGGLNAEIPSLFNITLTPINTGATIITIPTVTLLANDGKGTPLSVTTSSVSVVAQGAAGSSATTSTSGGLASRFTTPETFTPIIAHDPSIYDGEYFLVFSTTDKGSGIDHYDVLEIPAGSSVGPNPAWQLATSPYLLQDQTLSSDIYVRATNHAEQSIVVKLPAENPTGSNHTTRTDLLIVGALILLSAIGIFVTRKKRNAQ